MVITSSNGTGFVLITRVLVYHQSFMHSHLGTCVYPLAAVIYVSNPPWYDVMRLVCGQTQWLHSRAGKCCRAFLEVYLTCSFSTLQHANWSVQDTFLIVRLCPRSCIQEDWAAPWGWALYVKCKLNNSTGGLSMGCILHVQWLTFLFSSCRWVSPLWAMETSSLSPILAAVWRSAASLSASSSMECPSPSCSTSFLTITQNWRNRNTYFQTLSAPSSSRNVCGVSLTTALNPR